MKMRSELSRREFGEVVSGDLMSAVKNVVNQGLSSVGAHSDLMNKYPCNSGHIDENAWVTIGKIADFEMNSRRQVELIFSGAKKTFTVIADDQGLQVLYDEMYLATRLGEFGNVEINVSIKWPENKIFSILANEEVERG